MDVRPIFAMAVLALLLFGCQGRQPAANATAPQPSAPPVVNATPAGIEGLLVVEPEEPQLGEEKLPAVEPE